MVTPPGFFYDASTFAGESFLKKDVSVPDYASERMEVLLKMGTAAVAWLILLPAFMLWLSSINSTPTTIANGSKNNKMKTKTKTSPISSSASSQSPTISVDPIAVLICLIGCFSSIAYLAIYHSPDNGFTTRSIFTAPLFTREECHHLIQIAEGVAHRNQERVHNITNLPAEEISEDLQVMLPVIRQQQLSEDPMGWQKERHDKHPTTDINWITDPFDKTERAWLQEKLDARLAPTLSRLYGIPTESIRADDLFVVRYDGNRRAHLSRHTDSGDITFQALLSEDFEGGGTRYWNSHTDKAFADVLPSIGQMGIFPGLLAHEGLPVTKGRRYVLIGFLRVDRINPFYEDYPPFLRRAIPTAQKHVSWFATWGSLNWAGRKLEEGYKAANRNLEWGISKWTTHSHVRSLFFFLQDQLRSLGNSQSPHRYTTLVEDVHTKAFVDALDQAHQPKTTTQKDVPVVPSYMEDPVGFMVHQQAKPSWFAGQQINLDFDGKINSYWQSRADHSKLFRPHEI